MITLELADVEIDYCIICAGVWLDAGELEQLLGDVEKSKKLIKSFHIDTDCTEKPRRCPICDKKMDKVLAGSDTPKLLIDRCGKGDGLWFDAGELRDITAMADLDGDNKIQDLLADIFGKDRPAVQGE